MCRVRPPNRTETIAFDNGSFKPALDVDSDEKTVQLSLTDVSEKQAFAFDRIFAG